MTGVTMGFPPSVKVTVPEGDTPVTVAVNVMDWPTIEGLSDDTTLVAVCELWRLTVVVRVTLLFEELGSWVELETLTIAVTAPST